MDADSYMRQAVMTAHDYFIDARKILKDAEVEFTTSDIIALATVMAMDFHTMYSASVANKE
jgi:hypothetical protein